jgi:hypothetical protein
MQNDLVSSENPIVCPPRRMYRCVSRFPEDTSWPKSETRGRNWGASLRLCSVALTRLNPFPRRPAALGAAARRRPHIVPTRETPAPGRPTGSAGSAHSPRARQHGQRKHRRPQRDRLERAVEGQRAGIVRRAGRGHQGIDRPAGVSEPGPLMSVGQRGVRPERPPDRGTRPVVPFPVQDDELIGALPAIGDQHSPVTQRDEVDAAPEPRNAARHKQQQRQGGEEGEEAARHGGDSNPSEDGGRAPVPTPPLSILYHASNVIGLCMASVGPASHRWFAVQRVRPRQSGRRA